MARMYVSLHDEACEQERLANLRREINIGLEDVAAGRFSSKIASEIADEVRQAHFGE